MEENQQSGLGCPWASRSERENSVARGLGAGSLQQPASSGPSQLPHHPSGGPGRSLLSGPAPAGVSNLISTQQPQI